MMIDLQPSDIDHDVIRREIVQDVTLGLVAKC